ncbi:MAG: hypothetical protein PHI19_04170 [Clostridia bacterium]|nr:hypothetical protein [Clostridia bacterium]
MNRENVLREVLKAANTSIDSIKALESVNTDEQFSVALLEQERSYQDLEIKVKNIITNEKIGVKDEGFMPKVMLWGTTKVKTLVDNSPSKLAEMLIQGANMGVISLTKVENALEPGVDRSLLDELSAKYHNTVDTMKAYL